VVTAPPPAPGQHPAYMHALSNLRAARAYLSGPRGNSATKWDEKQAVGEINEAMKEIKAAAIDDGKSMDDHPPIDAGMLYGTRLDKSIELLLEARKDVSEHEDSRFANGLRDKAIGHIDNALRAVRAGKASASTGPETAPPPAGPTPVPAAAHPAYMTAIGNLRQARALLERPAGAADVKWDEHVAIKAIDDAFAEIRRARVDDGKPATEHAPIESKMVYRDRLREAEKQLSEAAKDLEEREDNSWAKGDRRKAVEAIRRAEKATHEAMADRKDDKVEKKEEKREEKADKREEKAEKKAAKGH